MARLGPVTPNVAGEASQFYDPATGTGPATQESGRVTALAIDPNCGKASARPALPPLGCCRGRRDLAHQQRAGCEARVDRAAGEPADERLWLAGRGRHDASGNTLYAAGEPNGSGDSEAGLGLFKSTDGG